MYRVCVLEESVYRGTQWVVFEPNNERLWSEIRLNLGAFLNDMFRKGAFHGSNSKEAYFVKCDNETTTQDDINKGIVNILVGFAPLNPAKFVIIKIQQLAGSSCDASVIKKEVIKAQYTAAEAQVRIKENLTGILEEMADVGVGMNKAEDKTEQMKAKAQALDEMIDSGALTDYTSNRDDIESELEK